ncbi:MAG: dTDP-4-dehydrorhamnose reductase [Rubrivivax sp.]|nr:dTDP-4-dehydrorhamnose reductase [Rubrivivax sp.]MDP3612212.1 dTDP-4-dehydrorhamnose reductase [Rubrivivax sp.]
MKILLLGKGGQVGWELQRSLAILGDVVACDFDSPGELKADFSDPGSLVPLIRRVRPDAIVNSAAHTAVDKAESEPELARAINALAPGVIAREAAALGACLVHYSTDYVYDGSGDQERDETAATAPLSVYGRTKLEGEKLIQGSGCTHLILRTSWVYAARGGNFARTMLRLAAEREELKVIADQIGAPTGADLLADVTALALPRLRQQPALGGVYHCVAGGQTSWHGYAQLVIEWARSKGHVVKVATDRVLAIPTSAYPTAAARPLNSRLNTAKLQSTFDVTLPPWQTGVQRMLTEVLG